MNENDFLLSLHSDNIISLRRDRPRSGVAKTAPRVMAAGIAVVLMLAAQTTFADSATWVPFPASGDWNNASNWTSGGPPDDSGDTATFGPSSKTDIFLTESVVIAGITFGPGAANNPFTITMVDFLFLSLGGAGVINNSGVTHSFVVDAGDTDGGRLVFENSATAGSLTTITNKGAPQNSPLAGWTIFVDTSTAGSAVITNEPAQWYSNPNVGNHYAGHTLFQASASGGSAMIINQGGGTFFDPANQFYPGTTTFNTTTTAGDATITNHGATGDGAEGSMTEFVGSANGGSATFNNHGGTVSGAFGGVAQFRETSSAQNAMISNHGGSASGALGGLTKFSETSNAGSAIISNNGSGFLGATGGSTIFEETWAADATITNNRATVHGAGAGETVFMAATAGSATITSNGASANGVAGGSTRFRNNSSGSVATIITNGGTNGGFGGTTAFYSFSDGGTATAVTNGNGAFDISPLDSVGMGIGSIEGSGNYFLGSKKLTVGSNNLSTTVSGVIQDGGQSMQNGGSLTKVGVGMLRLSGANTYTGLTTVSGGRLLANNSSGSGTGTGPVTVNNGSVLGGTGTISGPVTVNSGAALLGGNATTASGSLKVANNVTLSAGAIIQLVLGPSGAHSTLTRTGGTWSFAPNQKFTFLDLGAQPGAYNNIITGLAGDPGGVASWTITNAGFTGTFSYDGAGNIDLNLTAAAGPVLQLTSAVSRKMHGGLGPFDINLPLTGEPGVECRSSGGNHTLRFTFTNNVVSGNASVTTGTGTVLGTPAFAGKVMTVNLTGIADVQKITVTLSNVTDSLAQVLPDKTVSVNMLRGDTTGNKTVNSSDVSQTKGQSGLTVTSSNFREDVTVSGAINASDVSLVKARSGSGVP